MQASPLFLDTILTYHHHLHRRRLPSSHLPIQTGQYFVSPLILFASSLPNSSSKHRRRHNSLIISIHSTDRCDCSSFLSAKSSPPTSDSFPTSPPPPSPSSSDLSHSSTPIQNTILDFDEIKKRQLVLENFTYTHQVDRGSLQIRLMASDEVDETCMLFADSVSESTTLSRWMFTKNMTELEFLVKQYLTNQRLFLPHSATLVGFYKGRNDSGEEEEEEKLAGTVEISFNALGMHSSPPTPLPPRDHPYICNMIVKRELRRKGIGWHLLKACEQLMPLMLNNDDPQQQAPEVYLHCRVVNGGALSMYRKAGYSVVKKDNILVWLSFHRRKNLMYKKLLETDV